MKCWKQRRKTYPWTEMGGCWTGINIHRNLNTYRVFDDAGGKKVDGHGRDDGYGLGGSLQKPA
jgi:hypothetical protein